MASTLTRRSAKTVKDIKLKLFDCSNQHEKIKDWPRNKNVSAQNLDPEVASKTRIK